MPEITISESPMYAHCVDVLCPGNSQERVDGVSELREYRAYEVGAETNVSDPLTRIIDRSMEFYSFKDEADKPCPVCGGSREISPQKRPVLKRLSGVRQDALQLIQRYGSVAAGEAAEARAKANEAEKVAKETEQAVARQKAAKKREQKAKAELKKLDKPEPVETPERLKKLDKQPVETPEVA